jgi:hypothetical protein
MSNDLIRENFKRFGSGQIHINEFTKFLNEFFKVRYSGNKIRTVRNTELLDFEIILSPQDLKQVLNNYLQGKIDEKELSLWANYIITLDVYSPPKSDEDDKYENFWHIIQQLSTPEIDEEITFDGVRKHLERLMTEYNV